MEKGESCDAGSSDSNIDPRQYGAAVARGVTKISAATQNVIGSSDVEVQCVSTSDADCQQYALPGEFLGVGTDNCCYVRPRATPIYPADSETNVCRNTLISMNFNQIMDGAAGEISIDQRKNGGPCPTGSKEIVESGVTWCQGTIKATRSIIDDVKNKQTEFDWNVNNLLEAGKTYRVVLTNFKNKGGVLQMKNPYFWTFTAGNDICKIDKVEVSPNPIIFSNTKPLSPANPNGSPQPAAARAISFPDRPLSSIAGIYAWDLNWSPLSTDLISVSANAEAAIITAKGKDGEETLLATASSTADRFNINTEKQITGTARVIVFICEHPWPGLQTFPYVVDTTANASTYYCRDNSPKLLPDLTIPPAGASSGDILQEYLFPDPASGDAVGMRIYQNPNHLSPFSWYKSKLFVGNPMPSQVDGYDAIVDGRSTYVNAANHTGAANYTNIFVISYSQSASAEMQNIFNQMLKNWKFNTNLTNVEKCAQSKKTCISNADCNAGDTCATASKLCNITVRSCSSDLDCDAGDLCAADKNKIQRDTKRLSDFNNIAASFEFAKQKSAAYPQIISGSFLRGRSVSVWPSWQAALGNELGSALPVDPINKHGDCSGYDSTTCWNGTTGQYACPLGSRVYNYANLTQDSYKFGADLEYNSGIGWRNINSNFSTQGTCTYTLSNQVTQGTSAKCGDGIVGESEQCEKGNSMVASCIVGGKTGFQKLTCGANCQWDMTTASPCLAGQCGDDIKQSNEICDDGQNNGKYGYCKTDCSGTGQHCGDPYVNGPEQCDLGAENGIYGRGCSWDCKRPGPVCGDNIIQAGDEQCDGNSETKNTDNATPPAACPNITINGVSYPQQNTRTCNQAGSANQCTFGSWSGCQPAGVCGNAVKEGTEPCDVGGSSTSGACVMNCSASGSCDLSKTPAPYACKTAVCGDGYLRTGYEACDAGVNNSKECAAGYNRTCNYCGNSCNVITKTGDYCGDTKKNGPEDCDGSAFGTLTCRDFGFIEFNGQNNLQCPQSCKANTSKCIGILRINAGGPTPSFTDGNGNIWLSDINANAARFAVNGDNWPNTTDAITGADAGIEQIYKTERYSNDPVTKPQLEYIFNIGPGTYKVRLHFAEIWGGATKAGDRVFDIALESTTEAYNFDIIKEAGGRLKAIVKEYTIKVTDSALNIILTKSASSGNNGPAINAIEIEGSSGGASPAAPPPSPPACTNQCALNAKQCSGTSGYQICATSTNGCTSWSAVTSCPSGQTCFGGTCSTPAPACTPNCSGKQCGDDGCGGSCGTCRYGQECSGNVCTKCKQCETTGGFCEGNNNCICSVSVNGCAMKSCGACTFGCFMDGGVARCTNSP